MIHLYRYRHFDIEALGDMPYDMTQDGIGEALNISRSYASLILGRMNRDGLLRSGCRRGTPRCSGPGRSTAAARRTSTT